MRCLCSLVAACVVAGAAAEEASLKYSKEEGPLRIAVAGMSHGHVEGLLGQAQRRDDLEIVGVFEQDEKLFARLAGKYGLSVDLRRDDLGKMLDEVKPEAVSGMGSIRAHREVVQACAPRGVHVLLEKPLAFSRRDAEAMAALARKHGVLVLTNYETSWYASVREAGRLVQSGEFGPVGRMVFRHGHRGPREIGCAPEFLAWLTDPLENGGGAVVDFGCYGAVLATWLMEGERPETVRAVRRRTKPELYAEVDDDATIVLGYAAATAVIQASWNWPHDLKEMDVHTAKGTLYAGKWDRLEVRRPDGERVPAKVPPMAPFRDEWSYLREVVRGKAEVDPLSSLEFNLTVAWILNKARRAGMGDE